MDVLLDRYEQETVRSGTLAELPQNVVNEELASENPVDTAERSREILSGKDMDEVRASVRRNRIVLLEGAKSPLEMLREDRDR